MPSEDPQTPPELVDFLRALETGQIPGLTRRKSGAQTLRASELGSYLYCHRAWWYQRKGEPSGNQAELRTGTQLHEAHGRVVIAATLMRAAGVVLLLAALVMWAVYLTAQML